MICLFFTYSLETLTTYKRTGLRGVPCQGFEIKKINILVKESLTSLVCNPHLLNRLYVQRCENKCFIRYIKRDSKKSRD